MSTALKRKINGKSARIAVIGQGYVGLPLAVSFAKAGFRVTGLDKDADRVRKIQKKISYILDVSPADLTRVVNNGRLVASMDFSVLKDMDVIIICVPTPLKRRYTPDVSYILGAVRTIRDNFKKGSLIILESTTYPGTTREMIKPILEKPGYKVGRDFFLAFSPERIDPGNKHFDVTRIPKVVGGLTPAGGQLTKLLYEKIIKQIHLVTSADAAEMTKLLENSFRIINIGWINEVAIMCRAMGINIWEVIEAAKTKPFGFMPFYPGLGVGGHCIPDDPLYLYWKARHHGFNSRYIKLSADTNFNMPAYAVGRLRDILKKKKRSLAGARVLVIGVTYKKDVKDLRKSPPLQFIELLQAKRCRVDYHDPIIPYLDIGRIKMNSVPLTPAKLARYDAVVMATDHTRLPYAKILKNAKLIYDVKNVFHKSANPKVNQL